MPILASNLGFNINSISILELIGSFSLILWLVTYPVPVNFVFMPKSFKMPTASLLEYPTTLGTVRLESLVIKKTLSFVVIVVSFSGYSFITLLPFPIIIILFIALLFNICFAASTFLFSNAGNYK